MQWRASLSRICSQCLRKIVLPSVNPDWELLLNNIRNNLISGTSQGYCNMEMSVASMKWICVGLCDASQAVLAVDRQKLRYCSISTLWKQRVCIRQNYVKHKIDQFIRTICFPNRVLKGEALIESGTSQGNPAGYSKGYALMSRQVSYLGEES